MVLGPASVFTEARQRYKWPWREGAWPCRLWGWVGRPPYAFPLLVAEALSCREMLRGTSVFWDSNLPSKGQKSSMALLWAKGLKTVLPLILPEQLDLQPHGLETGSLVYFEGVEEGNQPTAAARGSRFQIQRRCAWRPALRTHYMKILVFLETMGYKCQHFSLPLKVWILHSDFKVKITGVYYLFPEHPIPL